MDFIEEDLRRFQQRSASGAQQPAQETSSANLGGTGPATEEKTDLKQVVDNLLIADFFFILFALAWLGVGVATKGATGSSAVYEAWVGLWKPLFQPALGVLMLGALTSGLLSWIRDNNGEN